VEQQTGVMVAFFFPGAVQSALKAIPIEWPEGSEATDPAEFHVTLGYYGDIDEQPDTKKRLIEGVKVCCSKAGPALQGKISGLGRFSDVDKPGMDVIYASFDCPGLVNFRQELVRCTENAGFAVKTDHDFTAHITLAYIPSDSEVSLPAIEPIEVTQSEVVMAWGGEHAMVSFCSLTKLVFQVSLAKENWEASKHPKDKLGQFAPKGTVGAGPKAEDAPVSEYAHQAGAAAKEKMKAMLAAKVKIHAEVAALAEQEQTQQKSVEQFTHLKPKKDGTFQGYAGGQTARVVPVVGQAGGWSSQRYNYGKHAWVEYAYGDKEEMLQHAEAYLSNSYLSFVPKKPVKVKGAEAAPKAKLMQPHSSGKGWLGQVGNLQASVFKNPHTGQYLVNFCVGKTWGETVTAGTESMALIMAEGYLEHVGGSIANYDAGGKQPAAPTALKGPAVGSHGSQGGHAPHLHAGELYEDYGQDEQFKALDDDGYKQHSKIINKGLQSMADRWEFSIDTRSKIKHEVATKLSKMCGESYEVCNGVVKQWMYTSNDTDMRSLSLQQAVGEEFDVDLSEWQKKSASKATGSPLYPRATERKVLRAMYDNTQAWLAGLGYKPDDEILVYRGVHTHTAAKPGEQVDYNGNAMESWSLTPKAALVFAKSSGMVLAMKLPVRSFISTARSGSGCLNEGEILALGNVHSTAVVIK
jgi:2'-5' RNA ligase